jgi:hypothetical protein
MADPFEFGLEGCVPRPGDRVIPAEHFRKGGLTDRRLSEFLGGFGVEHSVALSNKEAPLELLPYDPETATHPLEDIRFEDVKRWMLSYTLSELRAKQAWGILYAGMIRAEAIQSRLERTPADKRTANELDLVEQPQALLNLMRLDGNEPLPHPSQKEHKKAIRDRGVLVADNLYRLAAARPNGQGAIIPKLNATYSEPLVALLNERIETHRTSGAETKT